MLIALVAGCGASAPAGGYRCAGENGACPSGLHCVCNLCVQRETQAACRLEVSVGTATTVREHQPIEVTIDATTNAGAAANEFEGTVELSFRLADGSSWGDVTPNTVKLLKGSATTTVRLNRETIPPQEAKLTAVHGENVAQSAPIHVTAPTLTKQATAIARAGFGWAKLIATYGFVVPDTSGFRMYFLGLEDLRMTTKLSVGVASSSDGKVFTPAGVPILSAGDHIITASPYRAAGKWRLAYSINNEGEIRLAESSDGMSAFTPVGTTPVLGKASCPYCNQVVWFPDVLQPASDEWQMFFGAGRCNVGMAPCMNLSDVTASIGRAHSSDGTAFTPEQAPVLSGEQGGEAYLASPRVLKDGSVYKMWYAFARSVPLGNPCLARVEIGYATSSDGFYWIRSPSNPVLVGGGAWENAGNNTVLPTAVVPRDGKDPASGLLLYYSPLENLLGLFCLAQGVGLATTN